MMLVRLGYTLAPLMRALPWPRRAALILENGSALVSETGIVLTEE